MSTWQAFLIEKIGKNEYNGKNHNFLMKILSVTSKNTLQRRCVAFTIFIIFSGMMQPVFASTTPDTL